MIAKNPSKRSSRLLIVVVAIVSAGRPNTVQYGSAITEGERYVTDEFRPAFSFEAVGEGWTLDGPEAPFVLALQNRRGRNP